MLRFRKLLVVLALTAALVLPVAAATTTAATTAATYKIVGIASVAIFPQASFGGAAVSESRTEHGVWNAVVSHDIGAILGGTFKFRSKVRTFADTITGGTFGTNPSGNCAKTTFGVHGVLNGGGSFDVTMTRFGYMSGSTCVVYFATVRGTATF